MIPPAALKPKKMATLLAACWLALYSTISASIFLENCTPNYIANAYGGGNGGEQSQGSEDRMLADERHQDPPEAAEHPEEQNVGFSFGPEQGK